MPKCTVCRGAGKVRSPGYEVKTICSACKGTGKTGKPAVPSDQASSPPKPTQTYTIPTPTYTIPTPTYTIPTSPYRDLPTPRQVFCLHVGTCRLYARAYARVQGHTYLHPPTCNMLRIGCYAPAGRPNPSSYGYLARAAQGFTRLGA